MYINVSIKNKTLIWRLSRQDRRNAIGPFLANELSLLIKKLKTELKTYKNGHFLYNFLIIAADIDKNDENPIWCGGGDLKELNSLNRNEADKYSKVMSKFCLDLQYLPIPVIAMVDGVVIGGGVELILSCDLVFCTQRSRFHFKQLQVGLPLGYGSSKIFIEKLGASLSMHLLLTSRQLDSLEALKLGIVQEVHPGNTELLDRITLFEEQIKLICPQAFSMQKKTFSNYLSSSSSLQKSERSLFIKCWKSKWHKNFLEKFFKSI
ncbi:MAG: enoyl-CoA hydratase/isomerase family protein [Oligoflexales bacterium]|nr:enoyl-CoA hydratase/isomerase family protein [Oligoflexales bacterium]